MRGCLITMTALVSERLRKKLLKIGILFVGRSFQKKTAPCYLKCCYNPTENSIVIDIATSNVEDNEFVNCLSNVFE